MVGQTNENGGFYFRAVTLGEYMIVIEREGFKRVEQLLTVLPDSAPVLRFQLEIASLSQTIDIVAQPELMGSDSPTPTALVSQNQITQTPGASRSNSLGMITDYVPGAYMIHDQLHIRGGHQVTWLVDGVPIPNTNIASNVGPQFDPKDIDYLEVQRGSYSAEYGDRTYGIFNVAPRSGFDSNREIEFVTGYGSFNQTNNQLRIGSHTNRFAYYGSLTGYRSDFGLATPTPEFLHDQSNGLGGFVSLVYNATPSDQIRLAASSRRDHYQVPNDPEAQAAGIRDVDQERDTFTNFSWVHTFNSRLLLTVSPFYHSNRVDYIGGYVGPVDENLPLIPTDQHESNYGGVQSVFSVLTHNNQVKLGYYGFLQSDSTFFGLRTGSDTGLSLSQKQDLRGSLQAGFLEDQFKPTPWLTLTGGLRLTRFEGQLSENAIDPRAGAAIRLPRLNWVLRGFYGRYYQAPPLLTVSGPLLDLALNQGIGFIPLRGEHDEEYQYGLAIPLGGWLVDTDYFHTRVRNLFDHNSLGNSNIFFPLTIEQGRIRGLEVMLRSPRLMGRVALSLAYSHQQAEGRGGITGGLTDFSYSPDYFLLDHDQRHTLNVGFNASLPRRSFVAGNIGYGSGFTDGEGPQHLPGHTLLDLSLGKSFGEKWSLGIHCLNVANRRLLLDNSATFGGTHYNDPRQIYAEMRFRFHY
jgi:outer membrane receptor for ferrienterochelin and colicin